MKNAEALSSWLASSTPDSPEPPQDSQTEALEALEKSARRDFVDLLVLIQKVVPYAEFAPRMPQARYRKLLLVACMDLLGELSEEEKVKRLGEPIDPLRKSKHGRDVRARVREAVLKLSEERDTAAMARDFEPTFAREKMRLALAGPASGRPQAVDAFLDRRSARKGREEGAGAFVLPAALLDALKAGFALGAAAADEAVSARRLNTPKLIGNGEV